MDGTTPVRDRAVERGVRAVRLHYALRRFGRGCQFGRGGGLTVASAASSGSLDRSRSATLRHCALAAAASFWAKAVAMTAAGAPRSWRPAFAKRLRIVRTRQRCQIACLAAEAFSPSCASKIASLTPRRSRRARNSVQEVSVSIPVEICRSKPKGHSLLGFD
jgi:hypothetical protein